ncbi:MAG: hypothetical protein GC185_00985 [Alphaproteobacteria bacterium]|nr:hypothetical protein [Alphaproteobacteria bacterium]
MPPKQDFNEKAKSYLYSINLRPKYSRKKDFSEDIREMAARIRQLARDEGYGRMVRVKFDDGSLNKIGVFFMNAPEKFAAKVKKLDGIQSVEKPTDRTAAASARRADGRKYKQPRKER